MAKEGIMEEIIHEEVLEEIYEMPFYVQNINNHRYVFISNKNENKK